MTFRRFAFAIGLVFALLASQLPEFIQQYRQRLGGAVDELTAAIADFDQQASAQSLSRDQGIARLEANGDMLARQRGENVVATVERRHRLDQQRDALATAGPVSQYVVLAADLDAGIARQAFADYQPAIPTTIGGFVAAAVGLLIGWLLTHLVALPVRRRRAGRAERSMA